MAAVYKTIAKQQKRREQDEEDEAALANMEMLSDESDTDSDEEEEEEDMIDDSEVEEGQNKQEVKESGNKSGYMPKTRVLMLTSRGVTHRHRHLLADLCALLPHTHKETKLDTRKKTAGYNFLLNSLAELHSCNVIFFLEAKKRGQDLYLWISRPPNGPTIKFHVNNMHTMGELSTGFAGNCLRGGRGVVVFDQSFDDSVTLSGKPGNEWRALVREMLKNVFCVPKRGVKGMKPFVDRVIGIYYVDGKIWIRVFEIRETEGGSAANVPGHQAEAMKLPAKDENDEDDKKNKKKQKKSRHQPGLPEISLVEIGPRFVLTPIVMLEGSFGGPVIYENREFVSPNQVRSELRMKKAARYASRQTGTTDRTVKKTGLGLTTEGQEHAAKDILAPKKVFA